MARSGSHGVGERLKERERDDRDEEIARLHAKVGEINMGSSPSFVRQPEGNGVAERAIRTLKEQLLWTRYFTTVEELRQALAAFAAEYNASWLRERHGYKTPNQIRAEQKALEAEAAMGTKMAA